MKCLIVGLVALTLLATTAQAVNIETVPVGNLGNDPDTRYNTPGYGRVDYVYNIGKYEVTAGQYTEFLNAVDPEGTNSDGLYNPVMNSNLHGCQITLNGSDYDFSGAPSGTASDWENRPVNHVSWYDAAMFANWLTSGNIHRGVYDTSAGAGWGNSAANSYTGITPRDSAAMDALVATYGKVWAIPTEDEWYKAAYHDKTAGLAATYFDYPTSSNTAPGYVNDSGNLSGTGTAFTEGGIDPGNYATYDGDLGINGIGPDYYRTEVGEWENSDSPYGTFDQGGNLWEFNETLIGSSSRGLRGCGWSDTSYGLAASDRGSYLYPTVRSYLVGFRVASIPEPSTFALLAMGAVALLAYAWRRRRRV